ESHTLTLHDALPILVTTYVPACGYTALQSAFPEAQMQTAPLDTHISRFSESITDFDAIGFGMGDGTHQETERALHELLEQHKLAAEVPPILFDSDAINIFAKNTSCHALLLPCSIF